MAALDPTDAHAFDLFLQVYGTLPRAGPGGDEHTRRALESVPGPPPGTILDLGCGPGAQTLALAGAVPGAHVVAVDLLPTMVVEAERRIAAAGLGRRARALVGDMAAPPVRIQSQDLVWSEGAIYNLGVTSALTTWRSLLRPGGAVAFTEPVWLVDAPPPEIADWWLAEYPALTDDRGVRAQVEAAGFATVTSFVLPPSAWWDQYYEPMGARVDDLRARLPEDETADEVASIAEREIDQFRRFSDCYSYAFFVVQPTG